MMRNHEYNDFDDDEFFSDCSFGDDHYISKSHYLEPLDKDFPAAAFDSAMKRAFDTPFFRGETRGKGHLRKTTSMSRSQYDELLKAAKMKTAHANFYVDDALAYEEAMLAESLKHERAMRKLEEEDAKWLEKDRRRLETDLKRERERAQRERERVESDVRREIERQKRDMDREVMRQKRAAQREIERVKRMARTYDDKYYSDYDAYGDVINERDVIRDRVIDAIFNDLDRLEKEGPGYWRKDNLIAITSSGTSADGHAQRMLATKVAQGLAAMGSSVLLVNHSDYSSQALDKPAATSTDNLYAWTHNGVVNDTLVPMCDKFDYVIVCAHWDRHAYWDQTGKTARANAVFFAGRVLFCGSTFPMRDAGKDLIERSFYIPVSRGFMALTMNPSGTSEAYGEGFQHRGTRNLVPQDNTVPVIAACYPQVDPVEIAKAVIGIGDPARFYASHKKSKSVVRAVRTNNFLFINTRPDAITLGTFGVGASAMVATVASAALQSIAAGVGLTSSVVLGALGAVTFAHRQARQEVSKKRSKKRTEKDIYPANTPIRSALTAPALGTKNGQATDQISAAMYMSDILWAKITDRYQSVKDRWSEYEFDITKMLDAPLMVDYTCATTASLAKAARKADDLKAAIDNERESGGTNIATLRGLFNDAVVDMEVAFEAAEQHATRVGISGFAQTEQKRIARSKQLFAVAADTGSSEHERQQALTADTKELKGVLNIPQQTLARIEATTRLQIAANPA